MKLQYRAGIQRRADNDQITANLANSPSNDGGKAMRFGIRNEVGTIYLAIETIGLSEFLYAIGALLDLGFVDELEQATVPQDNFDAIFRK